MGIRAKIISRCPFESLRALSLSLGGFAELGHRLSTMRPLVQLSDEEMRTESR